MEKSAILKNCWIVVNKCKRSNFIALQAHFIQVSKPWGIEFGDLPIYNQDYSNFLNSEKIQIITLHHRHTRNAIICRVKVYSFQFKGLCLMKSSSETLQNLPYFIHTKTQSCFFHFSFRATLLFPLMNALVYVDIDQGIH